MPKVWNQNNHASTPRGKWLDQRVSSWIELAPGLTCAVSWRGEDGGWKAWALGNMLPNAYETRDEAKRAALKQATASSNVVIKTARDVLNSVESLP